MDAFQIYAKEREAEGRRKKKRNEADCYGLNICVSPSPYVDMFNP